jgi:hypothetical protein
LIKILPGVSPIAVKGRYMENPIAASDPSTKALDVAQIPFDAYDW